MTINELKAIVESCNLRGGFDLEKEDFIILSVGYQLLGRVEYKENFKVNLNKHFYRIVPTENITKISHAIWDYTQTPLEQRGT